MTVQNPPIFIQAGSHPAEDVRRWMSAMVEDTPGVVAAGDMAVAENGTPNMSVDVAGGRAFIAGDEATYQGQYAVENRGTTNVVISASDPTNPRIDLIVARIKDAAYSGADNTFSIEVVTGTPAAVPADPTVPDNCLLLARVAVAALATSITNANITDLRTQTYALGVAGTRSRLDVVEGVWTSWTPVITQGATPTFTNTRSRFIQIGEVVHFNLDVTITSNGTASTAINVTLPVDAANTSAVAGVTGWMRDVSVGTVFGFIGYEGFLPGGFRLKSTSTDGSFGLLGANAFTAALASGDRIVAAGTYEAG